MTQGKSKTPSSVKAVLGKVPSLILDLVLKVTLAITLLAWASLVGQVLLKIPARQILTSYFEPVSLLAIGITFLSALLHTRQFRRRTTSTHEDPSAIVPSTFTVKSSSHILVPGGKEGRSISEPKPARGFRFGRSRSLGSPHHSTFGGSGNAGPLKNQGTALQRDLRKMGPAFVPPERLAVRIDAFSFNCQECDGAVSLPWSKVRLGLENSQLSINCPNCRSQYPFVYKQAKKQTLSVTFHDPTGQDLEYPSQNPSSKTAGAVGSQQRQVSVSSPGVDYDSSILRGN